MASGHRPSLIPSQRMVGQKSQIGVHSPALHPHVSSPGYLPGSPRQSGGISTSASEINLVAPSNGLHKYQFEYGDIEPLSSTQDLGRPDVYERTSNEDEDNMSEYNVRHGFIDKAVLQNELYSAHELIYDRLSNTGIIYGLEQFMINVLKRMHDSTHLTGESTYRPPNRVTLNDQKRDAWMADLAGEVSRSTPTTPTPKLSKLARTVPHGLRGEKLLDAIASRSVPVQRACWLIRSVGYGEIVQNSRTKPNYTQQQYTLEWTSVFNAWIRKKISSAPSAPPESPTPNAQVNGKKSATTKENDEQRASSALGYAFRLARYLYVEGLLDQRSWLKSCIDTFSRVDLPCRGLSLPLIEMYSGDFHRSRALLKMLLEACQQRLEESHKFQEDIDQTVNFRIRTILMTTLLSVPDAFVHPSLWPRLEPTLSQALGQIEDLPHDQLSFVSGLQLAKLKLIVAERLREIGHRNKAFLAQEASPRTQRLNVKLERAEMLDEISSITDYSALAKRLFDGSSDEAIISLTEWATTRMKTGEWRIYAAVSLLKQFCKTTSMKAIVQGSLLSFLNDTTIEYNNSISRLFGELIAAGLFSYGKYLQRLIARGDLQPSRKGDEVTQRHLYFLQMFPLSGCSKEQMNQRRVVISDSTIVDAAVMEKNINSVVDKIKARLPGIFPSFDVAETANFDASTADYMSTSLHRDAQLRIAREWLVPSVKNYIVQHISIGEDNWRVMTMPGSSLLDVPQFCFVIRSLELLYDYRSVLDLCLWMLDRTHERDLLECAVLTMLRHLQTFGAMTENDNMLSILIAKHANMRQKGTSFRNMMRLILRLSNDTTLRNQLETELNLNLPSMASQLSTPPPAYFPEVRSLQDDPDSNAAKTLASTLHFRYASYPNWILLVIENSMMTVLEIAEAMTDKVMLRSVAQRHTQLLLEIGERDPNDFTMAMSEWMTGKVSVGTNGENNIFNRKGISTVILLIIGLCQRGTFAVALVIERLALPMMTAAAAVDHKQNDLLEQVSKGVLSLIFLLRALLISGQNTSAADELELTLEEILHLETQRTMLGPACANIATILHHLHVLHGYLPFNDPLSHAIHRFERDLADDSGFKATAMQNMEVFYPKLTSGDTQSSKKGMEFLKTMLESANSLHMASSAADQFRELVSRACEWNFRETQIAFRLVLDRAAIPEDEMDDSMPSQSPETVIALIVEQFFVGLVFNDKLDERQLCDLLTGMKLSTSSMFYRYGESLLFNGPQGFLASMTVKHPDISRTAFMKYWQTYLSVMAKLKIQDNSMIKNAFVHIVTLEEESETFKKMTTTYGQAKGEETGEDWENLSIDEIRTCLLVRLRLVQMSYPAEIDEVWVMTLLRLSFTPLIHKDGLNDDLFTIVLDIISVMIDALSKPARQNVMMFLRTLNLDEFPRNLLLRLARILPFEVRNMYTRGLKLKNGGAVPLRPWDWLEDAGKAGDCTGANEAPISLGVFGAKRIKYEETL